MVSTRGHPESFDEPITSPSKSPTKRNTTTTISRARKPTKWAHTPSNATLIWLAISLPLVIWDTGYVMLRPHSMPGGAVHWPIWQPYELYGKVDYIYGWKAFNEGNGFTAAQGTLNIVETIMYLYYLYVFYTYGKQSAAKGRGAPAPEKVGFLGEQRYVEGKMGAFAVLVVFAASVMTTSKTVLYWLNESYSGFENIGHNSAIDLLFLWLIPNGAWIILPTYMIYVSGSEILQGLTIAAGGDEKTE